MTTLKPIVAVVENDSALLKALERLLRAHGYSAELYTSAEAFLEKNTKKEIACLVLDINLGGISGLELQRQLIKEGSAPPIVFITGQSEEKSMQQAQSMGCIAYLKKPFESQLLIQALDKALQAS